MSYRPHRFAMMFAAAIAFASSMVGCSTPEGIAQEEAFQTPNGIAIVDTLTTVATVTAIDPANAR